MNSYKRLHEMYVKNDLAFRMALGQLLRWGVNDSLDITDEEIKEVKIDMMADWLAQDLYTYAREMAKIENEDYGAIIKFCMVEKIFDTKGFKTKSA